MSAVGKSTVILELVARGHRAVDLDTPQWSHLVPDESAFAQALTTNPLDWTWRQDEVRTLLSGDGDDPLFVAGTSTHQGRLYSLLDHVVLLWIPEAVARTRLAERTTSDYGKVPAELARELELRATVQPLLRRSACCEIDSSGHTPADVATVVTEHARGARCRTLEAGAE